MISWPLFRQSAKINFTKWIIVTIASLLLVVIVMLLLSNMKSIEASKNLNKMFDDSYEQSDLKKNVLDNYLALSKVYNIINSSYDSVNGVVNSTVDAYNYYYGSNDLSERICNNISDNNSRSICTDTIKMKDNDNNISNIDISSEIITNNIVNSIDTKIKKSEVKKASLYFLDKFSNSEFNRDDDLANIIDYLCSIFFDNSKFKDVNIRLFIEKEVSQYNLMINNSYDEKTAYKQTVSGVVDMMPDSVRKNLIELKEYDTPTLVMGYILYKIALLLLPLAFIVITANGLIVGGVDSGSMAYILSTSIKREKIVFTQAVYLIFSILSMFFIVGIGSLIINNFFIPNQKLFISNLELIKLNMASFFVAFAISGICFFTSCFFDREKRALSVSGCVSVFFVICAILALFSEKIIPSSTRIDVMNYFNYLTIFSLFDATSIFNGTNNYLIGISVLFTIGFIMYVIGFIKFRRKDLAL